MSEWTYKTLDELIRSKAVELGRGDIISKIDIEACPGPHPIYSSSAQGDGKFGEYGKFMFDEELISWSVDGGGNVFHRPRHKFSVTNVSGYLRLLTNELFYKFVFYSLTDQHRYITFDYTTKAHPSVIRKLYSIPSISKREQERIATILSTLDEVIEATEKLVGKHQQIKAGLMHDLFTRGLWTRPELSRGDHHGLPCEATAKEGQLRPTPEEAPGIYQDSPIGLIPKGWCAKQLPQVVDFWDGKRIPLKEDDRAEMEGDIPYYGASGIIDWIDRWLFDDELILLGEDGENIISRNLPLAFKVVGKCWINNHAHVMKPKSGQSIDYWTNYLEWRDYSRMTSGSAQPKITQSHLSRMHVAEPSEREQIAIAKRMDAVHHLIAEETTHLAKLRQQKQGLMHDLLTGRVRVSH